MLAFGFNSNLFAVPLLFQKIDENFQKVKSSRETIV